MVPDADLRIKLPVFEGPLDLLLFLIRKNELDIYDIPIAAVTKQYIQVLRSMQQLDLEIAGEFFVMAASLMEIKSRMLLPRGQAATGEGDDDDPLDPRWELVHQLLQYKKFKEAAAKLDELASFQRDMLARQVIEVAVTENERPLKPVDRIELWNSFNLVLRRLSEKLVVGEIKGEEVTVSDKMEELLKLIETRKSFLFTELFEGKQVTVRLLVATFIAVLELTRLKKLRVRQDEAFADIHVEAVENTLNPDGTLAAGQLNFSPEAPSSAAALPLPPLGASLVEPPPEPAVAEPPAGDELPRVPVVDGYAAIPAVLDATPAEPAPASLAEAAPDAVASESAAIAPEAAPLQVEAAAEEPIASAEIASPASPAAEPAPEPVVEPVAESTVEPSPDAPPLASESTPPATETLAPVAEQIPPQNPLDTPPPRDTLTS